ncbi:hypothetical protein NPIL_577911 [Nephila pilipes]|uniref:Uncharacterized protein n=1 Tax=Nephila pilipes TaxID=299642 RepID=A0A8X6TWB3_NEPPI|nr:hypothetical protein NPIL_577911 [Nephila pilipes]
MTADASVDGRVNSEDERRHKDEGKDNDKIGKRKKHSKKCKKKDRDDLAGRHMHLQYSYFARAGRKECYCDRIIRHEVVNIGLTSIQEFGHKIAASQGIDPSVYDLIHRLKAEAWIDYARDVYRSNDTVMSILTIVKEMLQSYAYSRDMEDISNDRNDSTPDAAGAAALPTDFTVITIGDAMDFLYKMWDVKDDLDVEVLAQRAHTQGVLLPDDEVLRFFFILVEALLKEDRYILSDEDDEDSLSSASASSSRVESPLLDDSIRTPSPKRACYVHT